MGGEGGGEVGLVLAGVSFGGGRGKEGGGRGKEGEEGEWMRGDGVAAMECKG